MKVVAKKRKNVFLINNYSIDAAHLKPDNANFRTVKSGIIQFQSQIGND